jgi:hypothetical protein
MQRSDFLSTPDWHDESRTLVLLFFAIHGSKVGRRFAIHGPKMLRLRSSRCPALSCAVEHSQGLIWEYAVALPLHIYSPVARVCACLGKLRPSERKAGCGRGVPAGILWKTSHTNTLSRGSNRTRHTGRMPCNQEESDAAARRPSQSEQSRTCWAPANTM